MAANQAAGPVTGARRGVPRGLSERDARLLIADMKRVVFVTGTCVGLLAVLVAVDRLF